MACVRSVGCGEGLAAWRALALEYEPMTHKRWNAMLMGLLNPSWDKKSASEGFNISLLEWERRIREYESGSGRSFPSKLKVATVCAHAPEIYADCSRLGAPTFEDDYQEISGLDASIHRLSHL